MVDDARTKLNKRLIQLYHMATHAGSNPHEAELAMTRMRKMMAEHDLAMADVEQLATGTVAAKVIEIVDVLAYRRKGLLARYDSVIARAVAVLTSTHAYLNTNRLGSQTWQSMKFVGTPADAELAAQLFHVFLRSARQYARIQYGPKWAQPHSSFVVGFGTRLEERARDWKSVVEPARQQTYALVLVSKESAIRSFLDTNIQWDKEKKARDWKLDPDGYLAGRRQADRTDMLVQKKVGA
jgi:hypothetical protein